MENFSLAVESLVSETLTLSANVLDLYGPYRKDLVAKWKETFTLAAGFDDSSLDYWGQVRRLFWAHVHKQTMANEEFRKAVYSILIEIYGQTEGERGFTVIFTPPFNYK